MAPINCNLKKNSTLKKCQKEFKDRFKVIKHGQFFGGKDVFRIIDAKKSGVDMQWVKKKFPSRKDANNYVKENGQELSVKAKKIKSKTSKEDRDYLKRVLRGKK